LLALRSFFSVNLLESLSFRILVRELHLEVVFAEVSPQFFVSAKLVEEVVGSRESTNISDGQLVQNSKCSKSREFREETFSGLIVDNSTTDIFFMFRQFFSRAFQNGQLRTVRPIVGHAARTFATQATFNSVGRIAAGLTVGVGVGMYGLWATTTAHAVENVPLAGIPGTKNERTFIAVKPDGVQRAIVGEIIKRFEEKGYKLVALKMVQPTEDFAKQHYSDLSTKPFFPGLVKFFSSGPVVAMVWEGRGVIAGGRRLLGATNPDDSPPGSIRGDLCVNIGRNIIHGSDVASSAKDEIELWFKSGEVLNWDKADSTWVNEK